MSRQSPDHSSPYKQLESYRIEDGPLFFGRSRVATHLLNCIQANRLTVLHAPSGAGKSSLLNAAVLPGLEKKGWLTVRATPGVNPLEATRTALIAALLPDPQHEHAAAARAGEFFGEGLTIAEALKYARKLKAKKVQEWRRLIRFSDASAPAAHGRPLFSRLLAETIDIPRLNEHLQQVLGPLVDHVLPTTTLGAIRDLFSGSSFAQGRGRLIAELMGSEARLVDLFRTALRVYRLPRTGIRFVLILDQFEELFTLFVDSPPLASAHTAPDWRLRPQFLDELAELYWAVVENSSQPEIGCLRIVVSVRDDFVGRTAPLKRLAAEVSDNYFRLDFLTEEEAREAIERPAAMVGVQWERQCLDDVVGALIREESFVEPTQLQIVCHKLWTLRAEHTIGAAALTAAGGVRGILAAFFSESLADVAFTADDRLEALDMLSLLVTGERTRNIVPKAVLVGGPYRDVGLRTHLIDRLIARRLLRAERREDDEFIEVVHEFLIAPLQQELATDDALSLSDLRRALERLHAMERGLTADDKEFLREDWRVIDHAFPRLTLSRWATELMFREVLRSTDAADMPDRAHILLWLRRLEANPPRADWLAPRLADESLQQSPVVERRVAVMSKGELHALHSVDWDASLGSLARIAAIRRLVKISGPGDRAALSKVIAWLT